MVSFPQECELRVEEESATFRQIANRPRMPSSRTDASTSEGDDCIPFFLMRTASEKHIDFDPTHRLRTAMMREME